MLTKIHIQKSVMNEIDEIRQEEKMRRAILRKFTDENESIACSGKLTEKNKQRLSLERGQKNKDNCGSSEKKYQPNSFWFYEDD